MKNKTKNIILTHKQNLQTVNNISINMILSRINSINQIYQSNSNNLTLELIKEVMQLNQYLKQLIQDDYTNNILLQTNKLYKQITNK